MQPTIRNKDPLGGPLPFRMVIFPTHEFPPGPGRYEHFFLADLSLTEALPPLQTRPVVVRLPDGRLYQVTGIQFQKHVHTGRRQNPHKIIVREIGYGTENDTPN